MSTGNDSEEREEGSGPGPPNNRSALDGPPQDRIRAPQKFRTTRAPMGDALASEGDGDKRPTAQGAEFSSRTSTIYASVPVEDGEVGRTAARSDGPRTERTGRSDPRRDAPAPSAGRRRSDSLADADAKRPASRPRIGPLPPPPSLPTLPRVAPKFSSGNTSIAAATAAAGNGFALGASGATNVPVRGFNYHAHPLLSGIPPALIVQMGASLAAANAASASNAAWHRSLFPAPTGGAAPFQGASGSPAASPAPSHSLRAEALHRSQPMAPSAHATSFLSSSLMPPMYFAYDPMSVALAAQRGVPSGVGPSARAAAGGAPVAAAAGPNVPHSLLLPPGRSPVTGRPAVPLSLQCDVDALSEYQCLVRKQIELFEAGTVDVESNAQGRNRPIVLGQVGIRCRHCSDLPPRERSRGATYYPAQLQGLYQACQNLSLTHLGKHCQRIPADVRSELEQLRKRKSSAGGGKKYWADAARILGVYEDGDGLRFAPR